MLKILRNNIVFLIAFCMVMPALAQQTRIAKDVKILVKHAAKSNDFSFAVLGFGFKQKPYDFVELEAINASKLNDVERTLIKNYKKVAFCFSGGSVFNAYWVKDTAGRLGLVKFSGEVLVPPLEGNICQLWRGKVVVGEKSFANQSQWLGALGKTISEHNGIGCGHFAAIVENAMNENIRMLIPLGTYDDIMFAIKGTKPYYFVAKLDGDELKWGVVDNNGKQEIACEHKSIYKANNKVGWLVANVGGKWKTSETMGMDEAASMVENREALARSRRARLNEILGQTGNAMISTAQTIEAAQALKNGGKEDDASAEGKAVGGSYQAQYRNWERRAKMNYNSLTNLGLRGTKNGKDVGGTTGQGAGSATYAQQKRTLREAQQEMKRIRQKAAKAGVKISKSEYEDVVVKY